MPYSFREEKNRVALYGVVHFSTVFYAPLTFLVAPVDRLFSNRIGHVSDCATKLS